MAVFFQNGAIGIAYFLVLMAYNIYLIYLSVVDIKKHELAYWQTGCTFPLAIACVVLQAVAENHYLNRVGTGAIPWTKYVLNHGAAALLIFAVFLIVALVRVRGKNAFGGADIWVITSLAIVCGLQNMTTALLAICISFLFCALIYRAVKKEKLQRAAFVPFITVGSIVSMIVYVV